MVLGINSKGEEIQVNTFIYALCKEAEDKLSLFTLSEEDKKLSDCYEEVWSTFCEEA